MRRTIAALALALAACTTSADAETALDICHSLDVLAADAIATGTAPDVDRDGLDDLNERALDANEHELTFVIASIAAAQDIGDRDLQAEAWAAADRICNP